MIRCRRCSFELGEFDKFGFLVCREKNGCESYHFVAEKVFMERFEEKCLHVNSDFVKGMYYVVNCKTCEIDIGKKFVTNRTTYIAIAKEKLSYNNVTLKKNDKWLPFLSTPPFEGFRKFTIDDFSRMPLRLRSGSGKGDQPQRVNQQGQGQRNQQEERNHLRSKKQLVQDYADTSSAWRDHPVPNDGFRNAHAMSGQKSVPSRSKVGDSTNEKVKFLQQKRQQWEAAQLIYEFIGPSKDNWQDIVSGLTTDVTGVLTSEVFILLSNAHIRDDPRSIDLYVPMTDHRAVMGMTYFVSNGPLGRQAVDSAGKPGGLPWMRVMDHALSAVETVAFMVSKFTSFQSNPMLGFVVAELSTNIDSLFGESYCRTRVLSDWCSTADEQTKVRAQNDATLISLHLKTIKDVNKESLRANFESAQEKDNTEKAKENYDRLAKQRVRDGVNFLNDVERDKDYLSTPVYPTAVDLTAPPPLALPQNIVSDVILNDGDEYKSLQRSTACAYRSTHHYLNTHYLLIRETCLAQLRRGVSAFRELLSGESQVETIDKPSPKDLDHACKQFLLLRGNDVAYIYGHVAVHGVDRMHDGIGYVVSFQMFDSRKIDWKNTSRFMNGSLLCLSSDGTFNTTSIVVATILRGVQQPTGML